MEEGSARITGPRELRAGCHSFASTVDWDGNEFSCLVRDVISWIVPLVQRRTRTIHEFTRTNTKPKYFRLALDVTFSQSRLSLMRAV